MMMMLGVTESPEGKTLPASAIHHILDWLIVLMAYEPNWYTFSCQVKGIPFQKIWTNTEKQTLKKPLSVWNLTDHDKLSVRQFQPPTQPDQTKDNAIINRWCHFMDLDLQ